jgi:hypothetical protein
MSIFCMSCFFSHVFSAWVCCVSKGAWESSKPPMWKCTSWSHVAWERPTVTNCLKWFDRKYVRCDPLLCCCSFDRLPRRFCWPTISFTTTTLFDWKRRDTRQWTCWMRLSVCFSLACLFVWLLVFLHCRARSFGNYIRWWVFDPQIFLQFHEHQSTISHRLPPKGIILCFCF